MKNGIMTLLLCVVMGFTTPAYAGVDMSILRGMSKEELQELQEEIQRRLDAIKEAEAEMDSESAGIWMVKYYVDEFNQPTEKGYVSASKYFEGTFSNTATTNSLLYVVPLFDEEVSFKLLEYGENVVKGYYSNGQKYSVSVLAPSGEKYSMEGVLRKGADRVTLNNSYTPYFYDILNENGSVKISMKEVDGTSTYLFEIPDSSFFSNAYLQVFDSVPHHNYGTAEEIEVKYDVSIDVADHVPTAIVNTSLPNGTSLIVRILDYLPRNESTPEVVSEVVDGHCCATFSDYYLSEYKDEIKIRVAINARQNTELFELYGDSLEKFTGIFTQDFEIPLK